MQTSKSVPLRLFPPAYELHFIVISKGNVIRFLLGVKTEKLSCEFAKTAERLSAGESMETIRRLPATMRAI